MHKAYTEYYLSQSGQGLREIGPLYTNHRIYQHGRGGVGSFFAGIFKYIKPLLYSGLKALKKQTLKTGVNVFNEMSNNNSNKPFKNILKEQGIAAFDELAEKGIRKLQKLNEQSGKGTAFSFPFEESRGRFQIKSNVKRSKGQSILARTGKQLPRKSKLSEKKKKKNTKKVSARKTKKINVKQNSKDIFS